VYEKIYPRTRWLIPSEESIRELFAHISLALLGEVPASHFIMHRETHAMCQASAVNAYISRRTYMANARYCTSARILFARSRRRSGVYPFLILFAFLPDTRRRENILWNITRARVTGAVWSARHANATRSSYVSAGFQKRRSGTSEMRHLDAGELPGGSLWQRIPWWLDHSAMEFDRDLSARATFSWNYAFRVSLCVLYK